MTCTKCGEKPKRGCGAFPKAVIEIDNPEKIVLLRKVLVPASMGDESTFPPTIGKYHNVLLYYEANHKSYLYSSDGIPTLLANGLTDYEEAVNLPQINGVTLIGDRTSSQLGLQPTLSVTPDTGIKLENNELSGLPATDTTIGMVKPGDGLEVDTNGTMSISDIEQYAHFFDTVADMKAANNLIAGDYARTLGYYAKNDDGMANYKIRTITNSDVIDEMTIISIGSGNLIAELNSEIIVPETLGAYGDGTHNDTAAIEKLISLNANGKQIRFCPKVYAINQTINVTLTKQCNLDFNGCTLKMLTPDTVIQLNATTLGQKQNGYFKNLTIDQNGTGTVGLEVYYAWRIAFENLIFRNIPLNGIGIWISGRGSATTVKSGGNSFTNIRGDGVLGSVYSSDSDYNTFIKIDTADNTFTDVDYERIKYGIEVNGFTTFSNIHGFVEGEHMFVDSYFMKFTRGAIITNCYPDTQEFAFIVSGNSPISISNCLLAFNNELVTDEELEAHPSYSFIATASNKNNVTVDGLQIQNNKQSLYTKSGQVINGTQYYRIFPIFKNVNSSYTSIAYDTRSMYISLNSTGDNLFTSSSQVDSHNAHVRMIAKGSYTANQVIASWPKNLFHCYTIVKGWHPAVIKPAAGSAFATGIHVTDDYEIRFASNMSSGDLIEFDIPVSEQQLAQ